MSTERGSEEVSVDVMGNGSSANSLGSESDTSSLQTYGRPQGSQEQEDIMATRTQQSEIATQFAAQAEDTTPQLLHIDDLRNCIIAGGIAEALVPKKTSPTQQSEIAAQFAAQAEANIPKQPSLCNVSATHQQSPTPQWIVGSLASVIPKGLEPKETSPTQQSEIAAQFAAQAEANIPKPPSLSNVSATHQQSPTPELIVGSLASVIPKGLEPKEEEEKQQMNEELEYEEMKPRRRFLGNIIAKQMRHWFEPRMDQYSAQVQKIKMSSRVRSMNSDWLSALRTADNSEDNGSRRVGGLGEFGRTRPPVNCHTQESEREKPVAVVRNGIIRRPAEQRSGGHESEHPKTPEKPSTPVLELTEDQMGSNNEAGATKSVEHGPREENGAHPPSRRQKLDDGKRECGCEYDQEKKLRQYQTFWANEYEWLKYDPGKAVMLCTFCTGYLEKYESAPGVSVEFTRIKKILINKEVVIGHGCRGAIVYKGKFDERDVAVKKLQREYFSLADQEVKLLREADQHPNVVRYYDMEEDKDFIYIALELCEGTLQDYVEGKLQNTKNIKSVELFRQILSAVEHLHSLGIVHRDLKPHNILISKPSAQGEVRAKISDFGLSRMLTPGQESFSSKSEVLGTIGWAAPEMSKSDQKRTHKVDIFSAGCLMYHALTKGLHPFGDSINERPYNIEKGISNLDGLPMTSDGEIAKDIIQKMLSNEPGNRPSAKAILHHPLFWDKEKTLMFIQDASDWIEVNKIHNLEHNGAKIVNVDWTKHLSQEIQTDIQRRRRYDGSIVKDLLRVIRNMRHHYNELPADVRKSLGSLPEQFLDYFTSRFPLLLMHTYHVMECCANVDTFKYYYKS